MQLLRPKNYFKRKQMLIKSKITSNYLEFKNFSMTVLSISMGFGGTIKNRNLHD